MAEYKKIDPRIHLGIDNCFAIKRWTAPREWGRVVNEMGMKYVEAVPDLECEPLLNPDDYRQEWIDEVNRMRDDTGTQVVMFYSNDSTYDSIGFSHPDRRIRRHFVEKWFGNFIKMASAIGSDIGYYVQATPESMLYSKEGRRQAAEYAYECMVDVNKMAGAAGIKHVALEQMYTPHQPPFTIKGMRDLIVNITKDSGVPFYLTEDVGHHCPLYMLPTDEALQKGAERYAQDGFVKPWLGSLEAYDMFTRFAKKGSLSASEIEALREDFAKNADQFNEYDDTDCYAWLRQLGCWSPVIHMQQTDGSHSSHEAFLPENNAHGKIHPVKVLRALAESYEKADRENMPGLCEDIYLIQELYLSTKDIGYQGVHKLKSSTDYLRKFIPEDGLTLSQLLEMNKDVI
ncbi:MAG: hypothetical protein E7337_05580 [Clostridiales bacterium]|nr:hypothetical protein [Clostridiales bacterium]